MMLLPLITHSQSFFILLIFSETLMALVFTLSSSKGVFGFSGFLGYLLVGFLSFAVCEAVLGLSMFIKSCRSCSSSDSDSFSILKF
uniref:NADH dehydrogenase subunit 4l n=1 Tax=Dreissena rostriformis TaxID=205083 RepID=A0A894JG26_9BIVA|nr:NADH dehydrogenase subunit 4L [Dreissena rostriformis]QRV59739.1 NADH dehydrogenase subunit 4l [Dreissena rostriformis]